MEDFSPVSVGVGLEGNGVAPGASRAGVRAAITLRFDADGEAFPASFSLGWGYRSVGHGYFPVLGEAAGAAVIPWAASMARARQNSEGGGLSQPVVSVAMPAICS